MTLNYYKEASEVPLNNTHKTLYLITEDVDFRQLPNPNGQRIGAIVPHIIANNTLHKSGVLQLQFNTNEAVNFYLNDMTQAFDIVLKEHSTILLFADALTQRFEPFIEILATKITHQSLFGSGIGSRSFIPMPTVFKDDNIYTEYALLAEINTTIKVGVQHGWEPLFGPLVVTKTEGTIVKEINHENAFELYAHTLKELANVTITKDNFFDIAKAYPLGILSYADNEFVVRDPLGPTPENGLLLVNSVPENETVYIMQGEAQNLINSASENALQTFKESQNSTNLLFDCISRVLYMEDDFEHELEAIRIASNNTPFMGITSIGEITNVGYDSIKIFNKTNLIGVIENES